MNSIEVYPIGRIEEKDGTARIVLAPEYRKGLKGLDGYSHVQIIWWADGCDNDVLRHTLVEGKPYRNGPDELGVFALRSPERPNPIAVTNANIICVDADVGTVGISYIDAFPGTAVLDLKPYTPSIDRVEKPVVPAWCTHWPQSCEESGSFDWAAEFNF